MQRPLGSRRTLLHPVERPSGCRIRRLPAGAERNIESSVPIDIVKRQADVVAWRRAAQNHSFLPAWRLEPYEIGGVYRDNVRSIIPVDVADGDGIANAEIGGDLLAAKLGQG